MHIFIQIARHINNDQESLSGLFSLEEAIIEFISLTAPPGAHELAIGNTPWSVYRREHRGCLVRSSKGMWKGISNGEHTQCQASKVMKRHMVPMEPLGMSFPAAPNATGSWWTEIKFGTTRKGPWAVEDGWVPKAFYFDLLIDQELAVPRKLFYLVFL